MDIQQTNNPIPMPLNNPEQPARKSSLLQRQGPALTRMEMDFLVAAARKALDPEAPDRLDLLGIYFNAWKDSQVISAYEKAKASLITHPFEVCPEGSDTPDAQRTRRLKRPWFTDFLIVALETEFWGYQLAEFGLMDEKGEFTGVSVFPREHVRPFEKQITISPRDPDGIPYGGLETDYFLLPLGDPLQLGKLESISREVIWKNYARTDWSEYNERYGKPFITFETDTDNDREREKRLEMAEGFGSGLVGVVGSNEKLTVTPALNWESLDNYKNLADFCDTQIAGLMDGQGELGKARLKRIEETVNYRLFPFLTTHGYELDGYEFKFCI